MSTPDGAETVNEWMEAAGADFHKISSTGFWSHIDKPDFKERIDFLLDTHKMAHVAQIMKAGCAHLLNGDYFCIVYWYLAIDRFRTLLHEFSKLPACDVERGYSLLH